MSFLQYLKAKPDLLAGFCKEYELDSYLTYLSHVHKSASRLRQKNDSFKKSTEPADHQSLFAKLGTFNESRMLKETFEKLKRAMEDGSHLDINIFIQVRYTLMLSLEIWNARRAGDFCNVTLEEWRKATGSSDPQDHVVFVKQHKTARSQLCSINFYGQLYDYSQLYVTAFRSFLLDGYLFQKVFFTEGQFQCRQMDESNVNKCFSRAWTQFREIEGDESLPLSINSRMIRHRAVSAIHTNDDPRDMNDAAATMSHSVTTARGVYNDGQQPASISRGGQRLRQLAASSSTSRPPSLR